MLSEYKQENNRSLPDTKTNKNYETLRSDKVENMEIKNLLICDLFDNQVL